jgi:hypothetical protein
MVGITTRSCWGSTIALGMLLASCGASEVREERRAFCALSRPETEGQQRPVTEAEWTRLVVGEASSGSSVTAACDRTPIRWQLPTECSPTLESAGDAQPIPLAPDSTTVRRYGNSKSFVFVKTHRYSNGEVLGPLAIVDKTPQGIFVRNLGVLRTREERLRLKINGAGNLLIAEGETCTDANDPASCTRGVRFLPIVDDQFHAAAIDLEDRQCVSPAMFTPSFSQTITLPNGWRRSFSLAASYEEKDDGVVIHEQVTIEDSDPRAPSVPPRRFRQVESDRFIRVNAGRLVSDKVPLWDRAMQEHGATTIPSATTTTTNR